MKLHIFTEPNAVEVWLDTDISEQDGVCIGRGATRDLAVADAVAELEAALVALQQPPATCETIDIGRDKL